MSDDTSDQDVVPVPRSELEMIGRGLFSLTEAIVELTAMMTEVHKALTPPADTLEK